MAEATSNTDSQEKKQQLTCQKCSKAADFEDEYCNKCGAELPDWESRRKFLNLKVAQNSIAVIAGCFFLSIPLAFLFQKASLLVLMESSVMGMIMTGLHFYSKKSPRPAVFTAAGLFATTLVLSAINNPETILQGAIIKLFVIVLLVNAIRSVLEFKEQKDPTKT